MLAERREIAEQPVEALPETFESVDALAEAIKAGQIHVRYTTREADEEWVRYALGDHEVSVKVARTDGRTYVVLSAAVGYENVAEPQEQVDILAAEMRYVRMANYAYLREGEGAVYTLKVRPRKATLACGVLGEADWGQVLIQLERLHRDLGELVERLES